MFHKTSEALEGYDIEICVGPRVSESARFENEDEACYDFTGAYSRAEE